MYTLFKSTTRIKRLLPEIIPGRSIATTTTCIIAMMVSRAKSSNRVICENKSRRPPLYGKSIPYQILSPIRRNASSSSQSSQEREEGSISKSVKDPMLILKDAASGEKKGKDKENCPLCKKYSQGPCGEMFTKWMDCIDANEDDESKCDKFIVPLDECLKANKGFYDQISLYDDDNEFTEDSIQKWEIFIQDLEEEIRSEFKHFHKDSKPEMQLRPEQHTGAAMFHEKDGKGRILLLVYVKDQDGKLLGAGSVEDLFEFQGQYVLRFKVSPDCRDVTAHGLYRDEEESNDGNGEDDIVIYRKTERIPARS